MAHHLPSQGLWLVVLELWLMSHARTWDLGLRRMHFPAFHEFLQILPHGLVQKYRLAAQRILDCLEAKVLDCQPEEWLYHLGLRRIG